MVIFNHMVKYYKDELSHVFYALADRNRREILHLVAKGPRKASDLAKRFDMSFPAVSKHVRILEEAGFVRRNVIGREHQIVHEDKSLKKADQWLQEHRKFWEDSLDRLEIYLKKKTKATRPQQEK